MIREVVMGVDCGCNACMMDSCESCATEKEKIRDVYISPAIVAAVRAYQDAYLSHEKLLDAAVASEHAEKVHGSEIIESENRCRLAMAQVRHYIEADAKERG